MTDESYKDETGLSLPKACGLIIKLVMIKPFVKTGACLVSCKSPCFDSADFRRCFLIIKSKQNKNLISSIKAFVLQKK